MADVNDRRPVSCLSGGAAPCRRLCSRWRRSASHKTDAQRANLPLCRRHNPTSAAVHPSCCLQYTMVTYIYQASFTHKWKPSNCNAYIGCNLTPEQWNTMLLAISPIESRCHVHLPSVFLFNPVTQQQPPFYGHHTRRRQPALSGTC